MTTLVELCAGTASVSLWALAQLRPLTGYMGSKRQDVGTLVGSMQLRGLERDLRVVLVDAGPWGDVWTTLRDDRLRAAVVSTLRRWHLRGDLVEVWPTLLYEPSSDPVDRAAQYLCLQARAAGCIPVWWSASSGRWESPSGARMGAALPDAGLNADGEREPGVQAAHQRGVCALETRSQGTTALAKRCKQPSGRKIGKLYRSYPARGLVHIETLARRVEALDAIDWSRVDVVHGDVREVEPVPDSIVYFDPPYVGCPRYAALLPRDDVLDVARRHAEVADLVVVSEAEPLLLDGWHAHRLRLTGKPEWVTMSRPPFWWPAVQQRLPLGLHG